MKLESGSIPHSDHGIAAGATQEAAAHGQGVHCAAVGVRAAAGHVGDPRLRQGPQREQLSVAGLLQGFVAGQEAFDGGILRSSSSSSAQPSGNAC